jgi:hypothetical protein
VDLAGVGPIGIGARGSDVQAAGSVVDARQPVALSFEPGVQTTAASVSDDALQGGRVRLALDWQVEASSTWARPLVWEVRLSNTEGQIIQRASGIDHIPSAIPGEHVLSWFTLDTPREIGPGPYQAHLRLLDADRGAAVGDEWVSAPFAIHQTARCRHTTASATCWAYSSVTKRCSCGRSEAAAWTHARMSRPSQSGGSLENAEDNTARASDRSSSVIECR